jgi:hypothetical protein
MKIITYGFVTNGEPSYLKNPWNLLDLIISLISLSSIAEFAQYLSVFKMFRVLRALRIINKSSGMRIGL